MSLLKRLWNDDAGAVVSIELVLVGSVLLLGLIVGLAALRDSVNNELADLGSAVDEINQTFRVDALIGHSAGVAGSEHVDNTDFCDRADDVLGQAEGCIDTATGAGANESTLATTDPTDVN